MSSSSLQTRNELFCWLVRLPPAAATAALASLGAEPLRFRADCDSRRGIFSTAVTALAEMMRRGGAPQLQDDGAVEAAALRFTAAAALCAVAESVRASPAVCRRGGAEGAEAVATAASGGHGILPW
jgi:hypothetical protein